MMNWKKKFNLSLLAALLFGSTLLGQVERSKKIDRSFDSKSTVEVHHKNGPLIVQTSPDGKVHVHAELKVKAKSDEAVEAVFNHFDLEANESGDRLDIVTDMGSYSLRVQNNNSWIQFGDGPKIKGVQRFEISVVLQIPPGMKKLVLENKYEDISIEETFPGNLDVTLYSGKLNTKDIGGEIELSMKYSEARMGKTGAAKLNIYDSNLWLGELASATVASKYSEFQIAGVGGRLEIEAYDDKWDVGHVKGLLKLKDKYSEFEFASLQDVDADVYDIQLEAESAGSINIDESKYSEFKFGKIKSLDCDQSYDDDMRIKEADAIEIDHSKYSEYRVEKLHEAFNIDETYDDKVELDWVSSKFKSISIDGKYTELDMDIESGAKFEVDVEMKYGSFDFDEKRLDVRMWKEKDSVKLIKGYVGGETSASKSFLTIKGYDNDVDWK